MEIKKIKQILMISFWTYISLAIILVLVYESEILEPGAFASDKVLEFGIVTTLEIFTICIVPLALRLFKFGRVSRDIKDNKVKALKRWAFLRLSMLGLPLVINTLLYYWFLATSFGYMAIILLLSILFVYPNESRCENELISNDDTQS